MPVNVHISVMSSAVHLAGSSSLNVGKYMKRASINKDLPKLCIRDQV